jgi:hypothetical protein
MLEALSRRLLPLLQLTRMALVFTAIADSFCTMLLLANSPIGGADSDSVIEPRRMLAIAAISIGLYGFGMSLNDIIDRRRDRQLAAHRPLPSGRVGIFTAHVICTLLILGAVLAGAYYARIAQNWWSLVLIIWTGALIAFYDAAGKYLVAPGLLALGLIRFFHAIAPAPRIPVLWHPLLLLNHVTILSTVAYTWEQKRPPLTRVHWWSVFGGLFLVDVVAIAVVVSHRRFANLALGPQLAFPAGAVVLFILLAWWVRRRSPSSREAGQNLMLYGLLWLIVYDASFVAGYVGWLDAIEFGLFLPAAYFSVQLMRWWSKLIAISQRPEFKRASV